MKNSLKNKHIFKHLNYLNFVLHKKTYFIIPGLGIT